MCPNADQILTVDLGAFGAINSITDVASDGSFGCARNRSRLTRGRSSALSTPFDTLFGCEAIYLM